MKKSGNGPKSKRRNVPEGAIKKKKRTGKQRSGSRKVRNTMEEVVDITMRRAVF